MNFSCPNCRVKIKHKPEQAGKRYACPKCQTPLTVPTLSEVAGGASLGNSLLDTGKPAAAPSTPPATPPSSDQPLWAYGKVLLEDFVVKRHLGRGGMGDVHLVRSRSSGNPFAVKRILPKWIQNEDRRHKFLAELRTWIELPEHPNLAACRFFRTADGETLLFAEYVAGGSLEEWIRAAKLAGLEQILDVAIQFAWGLEAAHQRGLVHQDVKPLNVLMTPQGVPKVTDFRLGQGPDRHSRRRRATCPRMFCLWT